MAVDSARIERHSDPAGVALILYRRFRENLHRIHAAALLGRRLDCESGYISQHRETTLEPLGYPLLVGGFTLFRRVAGQIVRGW